MGTTRLHTYFTLVFPQKLGGHPTQPLPTGLVILKKNSTLKEKKRKNDHLKNVFFITAADAR